MSRFATRHAIIIGGGASGVLLAYQLLQNPKFGFRVTLIENHENLGFARATNLGAGSGTAPYVLFLNPDTEIRPGTIDALIEVMRSQPEVGISGCRLERPDGTFDHASRRSFPTALGAVAQGGIYGNVHVVMDLGNVGFLDLVFGRLVDCLSGARFPFEWH